MTSPLTQTGKIVTPNEIAEATRGLMRPLVFTNGVFDILHRGHVTYLAQAKLLGTSLVVALNSDQSVRNLDKGKERPINPLDDRMAVVAALGSVDLVTFFEDDNPLRLIEKLKPDFLVKGGDWAAKDIIGSAQVESWGGVTVSIPFEFNRSTTNLIERIQRMRQE